MPPHHYLAKAAILLALCSGASATTLTVGAAQKYKTIQSAIDAASQGDFIAITPGSYGAANVYKSNLTLYGTAGGVILKGATFQSKGLIVVSAKNTAIRNLTFTGATSGDGNGAGIRMQGTNLIVLNSVFTDNQNGILADPNGGSTLTVKNSTFTRNGACVSSKGCAHGIYAGHIRMLDVENSSFTETRSGHAIKSRAITTSITGNTIKDGTTGTSSYLIDVPNGGAVSITGNKLQKGPKSSNSMTAIALGEEGASNPQSTMLIANNSFQNDFAKTQSFVWNSTGNKSLLVSGNVLTGYRTTVLKGSGQVTAAAPAAPSGSNGGIPSSASFAAQAVAVPEAPSIALFAGFLGLVAISGLRARRQKASGNICKASYTGHFARRHR